MATGKLVPIGDVKEVQLPIGGVVSEILVTDGQRVSKGDILIRLDAEASSQSVSSLKSQITQKQSQIEKTKQTTAEEHPQLMFKSILILRFLISWKI